MDRACLIYRSAGFRIVMGERTRGTNAVTPEADVFVREVLAGEINAFGELIRLYERHVWRIAASLLRDWAATENLVQHIFMDAYAHLDQYQLGTDFGAWVRTIARNRLRKELRSYSREERRLALYREQLAERMRADEPGRDDADLYLNALRHCRESLSEPDAELIRWRYEKGLSFEAIAQRTGQTPAAVQRMLSRVRSRLRACVEGQVHST